MRFSSTTSKKYDRASARYDQMEALVERLLFREARERALGNAGGDTLEIGVGTGKNLPFYPENVRLTGIDFSIGMLEKANAKARNFAGIDIELSLMDAEKMRFTDNSFDTVLSSFVFCTVPNPLIALREALRVLKPGGAAIFLEHMRSRHFTLNAALWVMNLFTRPLLGTSMLRDTETNIRATGFIVQNVEYLFLDVVRLMVARKAESPLSFGRR